MDGIDLRHIQTNLKDYKTDPAGLLKFDCPAVAINAFSIGDPGCKALRELVGFASALKHYAKSGRGRVRGTGGSVADKTQMTEEKPNDVMALLGYDPPGVAIKSYGDEALISKLIKFAEDLKKYAILMCDKAQPVFRKLKGSQLEAPDEIPSATMPTTLEGGNRGASVESDERDDGRNKKRKPTGKQTSQAREGENERAKEEEEHEEEGGDDEEEKPPDSKRSKQALKTDDDSIVVGILERGKLRHSLGLTRTVLNNHSSRLGLRGYFHPSQAVALVKGQNNIVSHIVLQHQELDISFVDRQNFHWRLGKKEHNVRMIPNLNPKKYAQKANAIFLKGKTISGPTQFYYIGHYVSVKVEPINNLHTTNDWKVEFMFDRYDTALESKLKNLTC